MTETPRTRPDESQRFRALAGLLAERGVQRLVIATEDRRWEVSARRTDLPGELTALRRENGTLEIAELGASIQFFGADLRCVCDDPSLMLDIMRALSAS